jgi:hypothetical protein
LRIAIVLLYKEKTIIKEFILSGMEFLYENTMVLKEKRRKVEVKEERINEAIEGKDLIFNSQ